MSGEEAKPLGTPAGSYMPQVGWAPSCGRHTLGKLHRCLHGLLSRWREAAGSALSSDLVRPVASLRADEPEAHLRPAPAPELNHVRSRHVRLIRVL